MPLVLFVCLCYADDMQRDDTSIRVRRSIKGRLNDYKNNKQLDSLNDALDRLLTSDELFSAMEAIRQEIQGLQKRVNALEQKR